jgi:hypothetical protein
MEAVPDVNQCMTMTYISGGGDVNAMQRLPGLGLVIHVKGGKNGSTNVARVNATCIPARSGRLFTFDIERG